jgi:hypothetical protein
MKSSIYLLAVLALFVTGCATVPVYNVSNAPVVSPAGALTEDQVGLAIVRAGSSLGWKMDQVTPGHIIGALYLREHVAKVDILYTATQYSINYKDSQKLKYKDDKIHRKYNYWVHNLDRTIRTQLSLM